LCSVLHKYTVNQIRNKHTLKAKFFRALATPGFGSYLLPALMRTVTADLGWLLSTTATLRPALSTAVAKERAIRWTVRGVDALAASMKEPFKQMLLQKIGEELVVYVS
jgi:hypothetical protein